VGGTLKHPSPHSVPGTRRDLNLQRASRPGRWLVWGVVTILSHADSNTDAPWRSTASGWAGGDTPQFIWSGWSARGVATEMAPSPGPCSGRGTAVIRDNRGSSRTLLQQIVGRLASSADGRSVPYSTRRPMTFVPKQLVHRCPVAGQADVECNPTHGQRRRAHLVLLCCCRPHDRTHHLHADAPVSAEAMQPPIETSTVSATARLDSKVKRPKRQGRLSLPKTQRVAKTGVLTRVGEPEQSRLSRCGAPTGGSSCASDGPSAAEGSHGRLASYALRMPICAQWWRGQSGAGPVLSCLRVPPCRLRHRPGGPQNGHGGLQRSRGVHSAR
jgi:hypothetical protein